MERNREIDSMDHGGYMRLVNHSEPKVFGNCIIELLFDGVQWNVHLKTAKKIKERRELFFDYAFGEVFDRFKWYSDYTNRFMLK